MRHRAPGGVLGVEAGVCPERGFQRRNDLERGFGFELRTTSMLREPSGEGVEGGGMADGDIVPGVDRGGVGGGTGRGAGAVCGRGGGA